MATSTPVWRALYPFPAQYQALNDGFRLHYVDTGSGDAVVLLHGNPSWSFLYRDVIAALQADWRVLAPDHLGCGLSDKPPQAAYTLAQHIRNLEELLLDRLGLQRLHLVVHDWGGAIGMGFAVRHPQAVGRLVVLNTAAFHLPRCPWRIRVCRWPALGPLLVRGCNAFARGALAMAIRHRERCTPAVRAGYLAPYGTWASRLALLRFVQDIPLTPRHPSWPTLTDLEARLPSLRQHPMLICWGMRDFCFTPHFLSRWQQLFPHARVHTFPDAGHYLLEDAGERVVPLIQSFLAE